MEWKMRFRAASPISIPIPLVGRKVRICIWLTGVVEHTPPPSPLHRTTMYIYPHHSGMIFFIFLAARPVGQQIQLTKWTCGAAACKIELHDSRTNLTGEPPSDDRFFIHVHW